MADGVTISVDTKQLDQVLMRKAAALRDLGQMLEEIGILAERSVKTNFQKGGRPDKWKPSRERASNRKMRKKREAQGKESRSQKTLIDTGNLRGSITHQVFGKEVAVGTNVLYAPIHHFGGTINHPGGTPYIVTGAMGEEGAQFLKKDGNYPKGTKFTKPHTITIPARPFLLLQAQDYKRINSIIRKYVEAG